MKTIELDSQFTTIADALALRPGQRGVAVIGCSCSYVDIRTNGLGVEFSLEGGAWIGFASELLDGRVKLVQFLHNLFLDGRSA